MTSAAAQDEGSATASPLAKELITDAALELQLIRARQVAAWREGRSGSEQPCEVAVGDSEQIMATLRNWVADTRLIVSVHDDPGPLQGWFDSLPGEANMIRHGYRMGSLVEARTVEKPLRGFLADQDDRDYRLGFVPLRIKLLDRVGVVMEGPVVDGERTAMLMRDRAALAAAARYVHAVRASAWRVREAGDDLVALSARQRTVANMLSGGLRDEEIADRLGVSLRTIRAEVAAVLELLGAATRFEAGFRYATLAAG